MIKTYKIRAKVTVQTYQSRQTIDVTDSVKSITTTKSLYNPSGTFQISFLPMRDEKGLSWYHKLSPMDYVEIHLTRDAAKREIPVIMRGFIDSINFSVSVDTQGRPMRTYSVTGRDYGKILELSYIYYLKEMDNDMQILALPSYVKIAQKWGVKVEEGDPVDIIEDLLGVAQKQLDHIKALYTKAPDLSYLGSDSIEGRLHSFSLSQDDGNVWAFMGFFSNPPWNELYIIDLSSGPVLVFRKAPWKDLDRSLIQGNDSTYNQTLGDSIIFEPNDIQSLDLTRSENELKNYFFTYPTQNLVGSDTSFKTYVLKGASGVENLKTNPYFLDLDDKDAGMDRFGFRRLENNSEYISTADEDLVVSKTLAESLNRKLMRAFRYNSAYESGSIVLRGSEQLIPGKYLKMYAGQASAVQPEYYMTQISHQISFEKDTEKWMTNVQVVRGTGFLDTRNLVESTEVESLRRVSGRY